MGDFAVRWTFFAIDVQVNRGSTTLQERTRSEVRQEMVESDIILIVILGPDRQRSGHTGGQIRNAIRTLVLISEYPEIGC